MPFDFDSLPETVQIGFQRLTIESMHDPDNPDYGKINWREGRILIHSEQSPSQAADTLWHEIIHGIFRDRVGPGDIENEEALVFNLSSGLSQVIYNNPELMIWTIIQLIGEKEWRNILKVQRTAKSPSSEKRPARRKSKVVVPLQESQGTCSISSSSAPES